MRIRLAVWFEIGGEARFLSHHDMMQLMERAVARARIPVKFSQGFNPRPKVALPLPRPVGVASREELCVLELTEELEPSRAVERLGLQVPEGVERIRAERLASGPMPHARRAEFSVPVAPADASLLRLRLEELTKLASWPCARPAARGPGKELDLKKLVTDLDLRAGTLRFALLAQDQVWARVEEVLGLLGLDAPTYRAKLVRCRADWDALGRQSPQISA